MQKRLLIISVKAGAGHLRAAAALEAAARAEYPRVETVNCDALEYANAAFRRSFTRTYESIVNHIPSVWGMIYEKLEKQPATSKLKRLSELSSRLNAHRIRAFVREFDPDAIICTHYLPAEVFASRRRKGKLRASLSIVLTDYDIHTMWIQNGADRYFVATDEMAHALQAKGVGPAEVHATGIPIMPEFAEKYPAKAVMRRRLGIDPKRVTVLLAAGGFGMAPLDEVVPLLLDEIPDVQFVTLAGRNDKLRSALEKVAAAHPGRVAPFGFVGNMHELMAASDLIVTKCGGLTSSECLAMGIPMVIISPIPGQEERNADFLLEAGVALKANSLAHLVYKVRKLLAAPAALRRMRRAALKAGKPDAATAILRVALG